MGRCCTHHHLPSEHWPGPGSFREPGCTCNTFSGKLQDHSSSRNFHTNPDHPRGWWSTLPAASAAQLAPDTVTVDKSLALITHAKVSINLKLQVKGDIVIEALSEQKEKDHWRNLAGERDAITKITFPNWEKLPGNRTFKWHGAVVIQTIYKRDSKDSRSCYGRGTVPNDIYKGRVSLGYHEYCHRKAYVDYLEANPLPAPILQAVKNKDEFESAMKIFEDKMTKYNSDIIEANVQAVDEVGHTKSTYQLTNRCYPHKF